MNKTIAHKTNPVHIYCRLLDLKFKKGTAARMTKLYEKYIYSLIKKISKGFEK